MLKLQLLSALCGCLLLASALGAASPYDLGALRRIAPGAPVPMPTEVFPPAYQAELLKHKDAAAISRADEYLKVPAETWRERVPLRVGVGWMWGPGNTDQWNTTCPYCLRPARFGKVDPYGGTAVMECCGATVYEDPARYPANDPGRPNRSFKIRHLDSQEVEYPYYEFADRYPRDQVWTPWSPADGGKKHEIFMPGGQIRQVRLADLVNRVIPDLGWAYFHTGDGKYATLLAALLDRFADLYPGWPLWLPYSGHHGFANNRANDGLLTREEYDSAVRPMRWGTQFWNTWDRSYSFGHGKMGAMMPHYEMGMYCHLVKAYAAIRGSQAARDYSQARYGDPEKLDQHLMTDLFGEMVKLSKCYEPWCGNYTQAWYEGAVFLSLLTQDRWCFDRVNELMERNLYDECYADHTTTQGSASYWSMVLSPLINAFDLRARLYDPEVKQRHPRLQHFPTAESLQLQLTSSRWIIPAFGDTWNHLYPTGEQRQAKPADALSATHFPQFGVSMLRWGPTDGRGTEGCLNYQRVSGHTHDDTLNLELLVDGLPIFWDMGYGNGTVDTDPLRNPHIKELLDAGYPRPIFDTGPYYKNGQGTVPGGHWWTAEWNQKAPAHCTVMVDEQPPVDAWTSAAAGLPVTLLTGSAQAPGSRLLEVLDVEERGVFGGKGPRVSQYRRALLTVQTPGGGGYLLDVFRVTGGKQHEFYYHAVSEQATGSLPEGTPLPGTLASYRNTCLAQPEKMKEIGHPEVLQTTNWSNGYRHINDLRRIDEEPPTWTLRWECNPALYAPRTKAARDNVADLLASQKPVTLGIHGVRQAGTEQDAWLWRARGLLTGHTREQLADGSWLNPGASTLGFVGGLDMLIEERRGAEGLKSTFVHVLEGHRADLPDEVVSVTNLPCTALPSGAVALQIKLADGHTDRVFCLSEPGAVKGKGFTFTGRYGLVRTDATGRVVASCLVRGSSLAWGTHVVKAVPEYAGTAVRFEGDLAGDRSKPGLVVRSGQPLPTGTALAGNPVNVISPDGWTEVYFIASVKPVGKGEYRLALQGHPTFILDFLTVGDADPQDPQAFYPQEKDLSKGMLGALTERNVTLLRLSDGKQYPVDVRFIMNPDWRERVVLRDSSPSFAASGLQRGDKCLILRHQPGDQVVIPLRKTGDTAPKSP